MSFFSSQALSTSGNVSFLPTLQTQNGPPPIPLAVNLISNSSSTTPPSHHGSSSSHKPQFLFESVKLNENTFLNFAEMTIDAKRQVVMVTYPKGATHDYTIDTRAHSEVS